MRKLEEFILEKLKISKTETKYHPNSKEELLDLIIKEIEANGPECSLNHIDVSNITDMSYLFRGGNKDQYFAGHPILSKFDGDISAWNVSNVTNMSCMFEECEYTGKNGDISDWDVSNVTDFSGMFYNSKFNGDISNWDVSNGTDMSFLFAFSTFTGKNGDISNWDVSSVIKMNSMFYGTLFSGDLSKWDVSNVTNMRNMFDRSSLENNPPAWYKKY